MLILAEAIKRARISSSPANLSEDRKKIREALEAKLGPVRGLIKTYNPAFTKDNHDSVGPDDYIMTVWRDGKLIPFKGKSDWGKKG
jgi:branched-chain amino acid transport system substrate-binding protein